MTDLTPAGPRGKFVWYEYLGPDLDAAAKFYAEVVGWTASNSGMPGAEYRLVGVGDALVAGLMAITDEMKAMGVRPCWTGYIWVEDVAAAAADLQARGGTVLRAPADIPGAGRFAVVADPQGAIFYLFRDAGGTPGAGLPPEAVGAVSWRELCVRDHGAALAFYRDFFGWKAAQTHDMGAMGAYQMFESAPGEMGGMFSRPDTPGGYWLYYFTVEALDAAIARLRDGGGQVVNGPHQVPGGAWIVQASDPFGGIFALTAGQR